MKMQHFKKQCRSILGPSRRPETLENSNLGLDEEDFLEEQINQVRLEDGRIIMLNKEYRG